MSSIGCVRRPFVQGFATVLLLSLVTPAIGHAAFSDFSNLGFNGSYAYSWAGFPLGPLEGESFTQIDSTPGIYSIRAEENPGNINDTEFRLLENELSMSWSHSLVMGPGGRAGAGSLLNVGFRTSSQVEVVFDGWLSASPDVGLFVVEAQVNSDFFNEVSNPFGVPDLLLAGDPYNTRLDSQVAVGSRDTRRPTVTFPIQGRLFGSPRFTLDPGVHFVRFYLQHEGREGGAGAEGADLSGYMGLRVIPEPSTALLCGLGLAGLATTKRRPTRAS